MESPPSNDVCSVCHDSFRLPCQANCSHWFCGHSATWTRMRHLFEENWSARSNIGNCILRVWHHGSAIQPCKCPICRRLITLLIPSETAQYQLHDNEASQVKENIAKYNRLFGGGSGSLMQRVWDLPFFIRRLLRELIDPQRSLPLVIRARMMFAMILSVVYVLSPVDILPEAILGIVGFLDDILIVLIVFLHIAAVYRSILLFRHGSHS